MLESASPPPSLYPRSLLPPFLSSFSFSPLSLPRHPGVSRGSRACRDALGDAAVIYRATDRIVAWLSRVLRALLRGWEGDGEKREEEQERKRAGRKQKRKGGGREKEIVFHYPVCLIPERFRCLYVGHRFSGSPSGPPASLDHHISPMPPCLRYLKVRHPVERARGRQ